MVSFFSRKKNNVSERIRQ